MSYLRKYLRVLVPTLTTRKLINAGMNELSYRRAKWFRFLTPEVWGSPVTLGMEPTTACNLRCPHCVSGQRSFTRPTGRMNIDNFERVIDRVHPDLMFLLLYFQGEPYLNPSFLDMITYAHGKKIFTSTSTNAHFLTPEKARLTAESGLSHLIVSADGITQETYEVYRKEGKLKTVIEGLRNLAEAKKKMKSITPLVDLQFIVFAHNEHEIPNLLSEGNTWGADRITLKSAQVYDYSEAGETWVPQSEIRRYDRKPDGSYQFKSKLPNECRKMWRGPEMTWDGEVLPCCFDKNAEHRMGNAFGGDILQIWKNGEQYRAYRKKLFSDRQSIGICNNCSEGLDN